MSAERPQPVRLRDAKTAADLERSRYEHVRVIGEGGMGTVSLVRDARIGRDVAQKRIVGDLLGDPETMARFEREIQLQGQLEHPAIVPVYDAGIGADGTPYFTMKRVRGDSLSDVLHKLADGEPTRFSRRKLLAAFSQLCLAVHYAHERGVVHRDIKPNNIMLGSYGEVYLLDWGVAKVAGEPEEDLRSSERALRVKRGEALTEVGDVMGTPSTMAPEQAIGATVDARTDVYALGAVLFWILTLEPLHPQGELDDVIEKIVRGVECRPSVRAPHIDVPPELEEIVVDATRVDPHQRLASALALHERVEAYLDGDRDLSLRREGARRHADAAKKEADDLFAAKSSTSGDEEAVRSRALREVGRALALDPENREALGTMVRLLTTPPKTPPAEVVAEIDTNNTRRIRLGAIACVLVYGYISLNAITTWQLGVKDPKAVLVAHLLWGSALVASGITVFRPSYRLLLTVFAIGLCASVYVTGVYGPYLLVPVFLTMHGVLFAQASSRKVRLSVVIATSLAWTLSVFGELNGVFPKVVQYVDGNMLMRSPVLVFPQAQTTFYLYAATLAAIVGPGLVVSALRAAAQKNEDAMRVQAWQLRRLVPEETKEGAGK
ncbi:MAG: serine/threonine protein kinase [Deltaproteobacteria bacterium]|nr:serine/threonine protein kinase [Deltaproteobacteria bacterium]